LTMQAPPLYQSTDSFGGVSTFTRTSSIVTNTENKTLCFGSVCR
jgi:hypothetical protein